MHRTIIKGLGTEEDQSMGKTEEYTVELEPLFYDPRNADELARRLIAGSNLPGPRANLELAEAFAEAVSTAPEPAAWLETLYEWAGIGAEEAPTGDPREFLPVCAVIALGVLFNTHACSYPCTGPCDCPLWPVQSEHLVETIHKAAGDPRWRLREATAMALQHLGEGNPEELRSILDGWLEDSSLTDRRAVLAALAHPPLLKDEKIARYALKTAERILKDAAAVPSERRKGEEFRILSKGLSYALSVFTVYLPDEGFALLERLVSSPDRDIRRVLRANLEKKRLQTADPERTARLLQTLGDARD
jgi:HEAT repeat protein